MKNKIFSSLLLLLFAFGISLFLKNQEEYLYVENRITMKNEDLKNSCSAENINFVMMDQIYFRDNIINIFLDVFKEFSYGNRNVCYNRDQIRINDIFLDNTYKLVDDAVYDTCANKGYNINEISNKYYDIKTFVYIPVRQLSEPILESVWIPNNYDKFNEIFRYYLGEKVRYRELEYPDDEINDLFYINDHHYNVFGADKVYRDIVDMINEEIDIGEPKELIDIQEITKDFKGAYSGICEYSKNTTETLYTGDYGINPNEYIYYVNGKETTLLNERNILKTYPIYKTFRTFDKFYHSNAGEFVFDYNSSEKKNILIFADSYIGPIKEVISSHFNRTIIISGENNLINLSLDDVIKKNDINIILFFWSQQNSYLNGYYFVPVD